MFLELPFKNAEEELKDDFRKAKSNVSDKFQAEHHTIKLCEVLTCCGSSAVAAYFVIEQFFWHSEVQLINLFIYSPAASRFSRILKDEVKQWSIKHVHKTSFVD